MAWWDVVVVGAGPAGLAAAHAAARAGARTLVLEKAAHPRYKTCGGGLIGESLRHVPPGMAVPARDLVTRATFTLRGRHEFTRAASSGSIVTMIRREEFDDALRRSALNAGAQLCERAPVRALVDGGDRVTVRLADGATESARTVIGADGSAGITARHVGVTYSQVDLGLEVELPVNEAQRDRWRGRLLIDWGPLPGSYGWVFPKDDLLTVGVIAGRGQGGRGQGGRGQGERTKAYLRSFISSVGLSGIEPRHDSGHLTRCRSEDSPLRRGRVIVAGDAAGLLEPWTREGISFALRSGQLAGVAAATDDLDAYPAAVAATLAPEMAAGRAMLGAFTRRPGLFHLALRTPVGWRWFVEFCQGRAALESALHRQWIRATLRLLV